MTFCRFVSSYSAKISEKKFLQPPKSELLTICGQAVHMAWKHLSTIPVDNLVH